MGVLQVCSNGYVLARCRCPNQHAPKITVPCDDECKLLHHRESNRMPIDKTTLEAVLTRLEAAVADATAALNALKEHLS